MKLILSWINTVSQSIGKARAAAYFTRTGRHDLARKVILED